jgi:hypothetical protein
MNSRFERIWLGASLLALSGAEAAVLYYMTDRSFRTVIGVLLLLPIMFVGSRLGVVDHFLSLVSPTIYPRRHTRMRTLVDHLLDEIRRLNALAMDGRLGVRGPEKTNEMLNSLESNLVELVGQIRAAAGETSAEAEGAFGEETGLPTSGQ